MILIHIQLKEGWGHNLTFIFNWYLKTYDIRDATIIFKKRHRKKTLLYCIYIPGDFVMPWIKMKKCIWNLCWRLYLSKNRELHSLSASEAFCMPDAQFFLKQVFYAKDWKFRVCYLLPSNFNIINNSCSISLCSMQIWPNQKPFPSIQQ